MPLTISTNNVVNFILFQVLWLACVLGAANNMLWPGILVFGIFCAWQLHPKHSARGDIKLLLTVAVIGTFLDTCWVKFGLIDYRTAMPFSGFAPVWIVTLWLGLSLTLNHSFRWLQHRPWLSVVFSAIGSPLSYWAGVKLGAAELPSNPIPTLVIFGLSWAIVLPAILQLARYWRWPTPTQSVVTVSAEQSA